MLSGNQKVDAIAWEAKKQGVSYGIFSTKLTEDKKQQIYNKYEKHLEAKQRAEKIRLKKHAGKKKVSRVLREK